MIETLPDEPRILLVDGIKSNQIALEQILNDNYQIEEAADYAGAARVLTSPNNHPSLIIINLALVSINGFELLNFIQNDDALSKIPIIFITDADNQTNFANNSGADYISKPFEANIIKLRVSNAIELYCYREKLESMVEKKSSALWDIEERFLETTANLIEYRSIESSSHVNRTRGLAKILVSHLIKTGVYAKELVDSNYSALIKAVPLHDIGKIAIPDRILLKAGKLTPKEFSVIKTHAAIGGDVIETLMVGEKDIYLKHCYDICRFHHERWDGSGYPDNLSQKDIPLSARIVSVVDVYDSLVNYRCYKAAFCHEDAIEIIKKESAKQFDPLIVKSLLDINESFKFYQENTPIS